MDRLNGKTFRKKMAAAAGLLLCLTVLISALFISLEANHHCHGEDCPVCACLQQCGNLLRFMGTGQVPQVAVMLPFFAFCSAVMIHTLLTVPATPVSRKVRMDD